MLEDEFPLELAYFQGQTVNLPEGTWWTHINYYCIWYNYGGQAILNIINISTILTIIGYKPFFYYYSQLTIINHYMDVFTIDNSPQ